MNAEFIEPDSNEYEESLNEIYGSISIGYVTFDAGHILREMDEYAYDIGFAEYCDEHCFWQCGECGAKFDNEKDAEECCEEEEELDI